MLNKSFLILFCVFAFSAAKAQYIEYSRAGVHIDVVKFITGTPEIQGEYFLNNYLGAVAVIGYTYRPVRGTFKIYDSAYLQSLHGGYGKFGLKGRVKFGAERAPMLWAQVMYVISNYEEYGRNVDGLLHNSGTVNGFAAATGLDINVAHRFSFRMGFQVGSYRRNDHLGEPALTYQPGFGSLEAGLPAQLILAFNYKIGSIFQGPGGCPKF